MPRPQHRLWLVVNLMSTWIITYIQGARYDMDREGRDVLAAGSPTSCTRANIPVDGYNADVFFKGDQDLQSYRLLDQVVL
ncbi:unnamed protein product [Fusarium venenatum]|uniref:Uncharacterized protein n=1 Tax=Fusarium venenatum TaxID=56646 RepID=A0A2L2TJY7_9HYPO|nr:uncharacterized protein FVRRES_08440 [Fusarium venenatum]CEI68363.1 unnamed protein product [Fusarium venenatum]